jgi:RNA polymerase sigma-70 factor (ECF subfamily)
MAMQPTVDELGIPMQMQAPRVHQGVEKLSARQERRLIAKARAGCQASARELVDAHKARLSAFVWRIVRDGHDVEEICQDAFLRAFGALDSFSMEYRFSTWLFTIAYRLCLNHIRRKQMLSGEVDLSVYAGQEPDSADRVAQSEEALRLKRVIWEAVDDLTAPQRAAIMLFYREGFSCGKIAGVLGMPMATVKSHLHRARNRLREALEPQVAGDWKCLKVLVDSA